MMTPLLSCHGLVTTVTMLAQFPTAITTVLYSSDSVEMLRTELNSCHTDLTLLRTPILFLAHT